MLRPKGTGLNSRSKNIEITTGCVGRPSESINVKINFLVFAGLANNLFDPYEEDCVVIKQVRSLGAVPFCQTNVPQVMYTLQTSNPIFGATGKCA